MANGIDWPQPIVMTVMILRKGKILGELNTLYRVCVCFGVFYDRWYDAIRHERKKFDVEKQQNDSSSTNKIVNFAVKRRQPHRKSVTTVTVMFSTVAKLSILRFTMT